MREKPKQRSCRWPAGRLLYAVLVGRSGGRGDGSFLQWPRPGAPLCCGGPECSASVAAFNTRRTLPVVARFGCPWRAFLPAVVVVLEDVGRQPAVAWHRVPLVCAACPAGWAPVLARYVPTGNSGIYMRISGRRACVRVNERWPAGWLAVCHCYLKWVLSTCVDCWRHAIALMVRLSPSVAR